MENYVELLVNNKDIIGIIILLPMIWYYIRSQNKAFEKIQEKLDNYLQENNQILKELITTMVNLNNSLKIHDENSKQQFEIIKENIQKPSLNKDQTIDLLESYMWLTTRKKLDFIKGIILSNHLEEKNKEKVRKKICSTLKNLSNEYLSKFSTYKTPIGDLSEWLQKNFTEKDFEQLIDNIMEIIYTKNDKSSIFTKIDEIASNMRILQSNLANRLAADLHKI